LGEGLFWGAVASTVYAVIVGFGIVLSPGFDVRSSDDVVGLAALGAVVFLYAGTIGAAIGAIAGVVVGLVSGTALALSSVGRTAQTFRSFTSARVIGAVCAALTMAALGTILVLNNMPLGIPSIRGDRTSTDLDDAGILFATLAVVPALIAGAIFAWRSPTIVRAGWSPTPRLATPDERRAAVARRDAHASTTDTGT
jgi:hypothetical protein